MELDRGSFDDIATPSQQAAAATTAATAASDGARSSRPTPMDLQTFLPWACNQLESPDEIVVTKAQQVEYISVNVDKVKRRKSKLDRAVSVYEMPQNELMGVKSIDTVKSSDAGKVKVTVIHNSQDKCTQLKFLNNRYIPGMLLKVLSLIVQFHAQLNMITINSGVNMYTLHELVNLLSHSNITEICFDGCGKSGLNYAVLFSRSNHLKHLSLARCNVDDKIVAEIAEHITFPEPASVNLKLLNLASNRITDHGARHLAAVLRTNRTLNYLNISGNRISDDGGAAILEVLGQFELTLEEVRLYKERHVVYLNQKFELLNELRTKLKAVEANAPRKLRKFDSTIIEQRAETLLNSYISRFSDPYSSRYTVSKDDKVYCKGNNTLAYLNLAYLNLHFETLKKLLSVMEYQKRRNDLPRGLMTVSIEGNPLPRACDEYEQLVLVMTGAPSARASSKRRPKSDESRTQ